MESQSATLKQKEKNYAKCAWLLKHYEISHPLKLMEKLTTFSSQVYHNILYSMQNLHYYIKP